MTKRRLTLRILLVIGTAFIISACSNDEQSLIQISETDITSFSIARFGEELVLEKNGSEWEVVVPLRTRANPEAVEKFLSTIGSLSVDEIVSQNPEDQSQYGVDDNAHLVTVRSPSKSQEIIVGRQGKDFQTQHIRVDGSESILLARGRINTIMRVDVWRYRMIMDLDPNDIVAADIFVSDANYRLFQTDSSWVLTDSLGTHSVVDERVDEWASFFNPLTTDRFAEVAPDLVEEHAQRKIVFELKDGSTHTLRFLDLQGEWGVTVDENEIVFQIFSLRLDNMFPDLLPFYDN